MSWPAPALVVGAAWRWPAPALLAAAAVGAAWRWPAPAPLAVVAEAVATAAPVASPVASPCLWALASACVTAASMFAACALLCFGVRQAVSLVSGTRGNVLPTHPPTLHTTTGQLPKHARCCQAATAAPAPGRSEFLLGGDGPCARNAPRPSRPYRHRLRYGPAHPCTSTHLRTSTWYRQCVVSDAQRPNGSADTRTPREATLTWPPRSKNSRLPRTSTHDLKNGRGAHNRQRWQTLAKEARLQPTSSAAPADVASILQSPLLYVNHQTHCTRNASAPSVPPTAI